MKDHAATIELPPLLAEIAGVVGREAALKFAAACGGTRIYMPVHVGHDHWLTEAIGPGAASALATHFSYGRRGIRLDVPKLPLAIRVAELDQVGATSREIALKLDIHQRTVHRHRQTRRNSKF